VIDMASTTTEADAKVPLNPDELPDEEEDEEGMSTGSKVAIGAALVGAGAAAALGIGALAAGGYYMYQSHESNKQNESGLKLVIRALAGHNLKSEDIGGASDPYLQVKVGKVTVASKHIEKTLNPVWNEEMTIGIYPEHTSKNIEISVYDKDTGRSDDFLGRAFVPMAKVPANRAKHFELGLSEQGSVTLELYVTGEGAVDGARCSPPPKRKAAGRKGGRHAKHHVAAGDDGDDDRRRKHGRQGRHGHSDDEEEEDDRHGRKHRRGRDRRGGRRAHKEEGDSDDHRRGRHQRRRERGQRHAEHVRGLDLEDGTEIRLESVAARKNLRITASGDVDCEGADGKYATFEVVRERGQGRFRLVNVGDDRNWLGVDEEGAFAADERDASEFKAIEEKGFLALQDTDTDLWLGVKPNGDVFTKAKRNTRVGKKVAFIVHRA